MRELARFGARLSMAAVFVIGGYDSATNPGGRTHLVAEAGFPAPDLAVRLNGVLMVLSGLAIAANLRPRLAAALLAGTIAPTTIVGHPFWKLDDQAARQREQIHFYKNLAIFGGAVHLALSPEAE